MKAGLYGRYATRALRREGLRTVLAVLCVAIGVMAIVALQLVGNMVDFSLTGNVRSLNGGDLDISGVILRANQLSYFQQLQADGTLASYTAVSSNQGSAQSPHPVSRFNVLLVDPAHYPLAGAPTFDAPHGGRLSAILDATTVVLTHSLAQQMDAHVGDRFTVTLADGHAATITVGGIVTNAGQFQQPLLLMSYSALATFAEATSHPLVYSEVYADVPGHAAARIAAVANQVQGQFPDASVLTAEDLLRNNQQEVTSILSFLRAIGLITLLLAGTGIVNTMRVLLRRRTTEIALLKASGYRHTDLYALFGLEAGLLGLLGGLVGAAAGIGASFVLKGAVENALALALPLTIDPTIVAAGVLVGVVTALIFGLLPIVQASQVRPLVVLRELTEGSRTATWAVTVALALLVAGLFYALALAILQDAVLALELVAGAAVALGLLGLLFALLGGVIGRIPVPGNFRGKGTIRLALRHLARQRSGTVMAQVALAVGVFAVGAILVLGQRVQAQYSSGGNDVNAIIWTQNLAPVQQRLQRSSAVTRLDVYRGTGFAPLAIDGRDISAAVAGHQYDRVGLTPLDGILGFDLAHHHVPAAPDYTLVAGRMLAASDAGSQNVVADAGLRAAPLNLALGDRFTVQYLDKRTFLGGGGPSGPTVTFTIVGFYQNNTGVPSLQETLLADYAAVDAVGGSNATYLLGIHVDPQQADALLTQLQAALPGQVFVHSYVDAFAGIEAYLRNLVLMLEALVFPALLAAAINIANVVALAMLDRRREVGILKAVGHSSRGVLAGVILEQGVAAFTASVVAVVGAVGLAIVLGLGQGMSDAVASGAGSPTAPGAGSSLLASVLPMAGEIVAAGVVLALVITGLVAWNASHRRPLEVLRYE
jgi:predicted lysophospholipase L1 biosynthesis ABC-type transport system permease subunit